MTSVTIGKKNRGFSIGRILTHILLIGVGVCWIYPFLWMIASSFKTNEEFWANRLSLIPASVNFDNFVRLWSKGNFDLYFLNTVIVTFFTVLLVLIMTNMTGYVLGRYEFTGKKFIKGLFLASICIPLVATIIPVYQVIRAMNLVGTRLGLILSSAGGGHVIFLLLFSSYYMQIPNDLEEAATLDGCNFFRTYLNVMLPVSMPICTTVVIMESIWTWNSFLLPLVLTMSNPASRTLAVGLYSFRGENIVDWTGIAAGGAISVIPIIILFIFMQKYFINGVAGAVKG